MRIYLENTSLCFKVSMTIGVLLCYSLEIKGTTRHCPQDCYCPNGRHGSETTACTLDTRKRTIFPCTVKLLRLRLRITQESPQLLPDNLFALCNYLEDLQLQPGSASRLTSGTLLGLDKLVRLVVSRGSIVELGSNLLSTTPELAFFKLSANRVVQIGSSVFSACGQLIFIDLSSNLIEHTDADSFESCRLVATMNLGGNRLSRVTPSSFSGLTGLKNLIITGNVIETIEDFAFSHASRLRYLLLNKNRLRVITQFALAKLYSLERLDLSYNKLTYISMGAFKDLIQLKSLYLQGNDLVSLRLSVFQGLGPSLQQVELGVLDCVIEYVGGRRPTSALVVQAFGQYPLCIGTRPVQTTTVATLLAEVNTTAILNFNDDSGNNSDTQSAGGSREVLSNLFYSNDAVKPAPSKRSSVRFPSSSFSEASQSRQNPILNRAQASLVVERVPVWLAGLTGFLLLALISALLALALVCVIKTAKIRRLEEAQKPPFPLLLQGRHSML